MKFSLNPMQMCRSAWIPFFRIKVHFFCYLLFFKECLSPQIKIKKLVNEQCRLPPQSLRINLKDTYCHVSIDSLGFCLSKMFVKISLKPVYPTMVGKNFQIYDA